MIYLFGLQSYIAFWMSGICGSVIGLGHGRILFGGPGALERNVFFAGLWALDKFLAGKKLEALVNVFVEF